MKKTIFLIAAIFFVLNAFSQGDFISVKDAAKKMNSPKCQIIDARSESEYQKVHIRNAMSVPVAGLSSESPVEGLLKNEKEINAFLGIHGVDLDKEIILYCNKGHSAGRMYWILNMLGAKDVKMLDGNLDGWKAERKPITKNPKMVRKNRLAAKLDKSTYLTIADVKSKVGQAGVVLVDARAPEYFNGSDENSKGHIPGAINVNTDDVKDAEGFLKPASDLQKLFDSKGITKDKEVVLYCQTSTRAGLLYAILTSVLDYDNVKVFDGAYNEWSSDASNKLES